MNPFVTANGKLVAAQLPCSLEEFLFAQAQLFNHLDSKAQSF
jgi:hypothetical protein